MFSTFSCRNCSESPAAVLLIVITIAVACPMTAAGGEVRYVPAAADGEIEKAITESKPGDTIVLRRGVHRGAVEFTTSGKPENPITLRGEDGAIIDGGWRGEFPRKSDHNHGAAIVGQRWIEIENITFENCWNRAIAVEDSSYISIRDCRFNCAGQAVYATGAGTHHLLIERCEWNPVGRAIWSWQWKEIKTGKYRCLAQGSILTGDTARGHFVIRDNKVDYVFNAFQYNARARNCFANIEVYRNRFDHIRDNAIEPENFIHNLHVYHNQLDNVSAFVISVDSCRGGPMFLYGNTGFFDFSDPAANMDASIFKFVFQRQPGDPKFEQNSLFLDEPIHILHNSWRYSQGMRSSSEGARYQHNVRHFNNAYAFAHPRQGLQMGKWDKIWAESAPDYDGSRYDHDCVNRPWPAAIRNTGMEANGLENTEPGFVDAVGGDFVLRPGSPCIDAGIEVEGFTQFYRGAAPDIGAFEGTRRIEGPPFFVTVPPGGLGYEERPRITRHRIDGSTLTLFFSWSIEPKSVDATMFHLTSASESANVESLHFGLTNRELILEADRPLDIRSLTLRMDPLPTGENGQPATHWASTVLPSTPKSSR